MEMVEFEGELKPPNTGPLSDEEAREMYDSVLEIRDNFRSISMALAQFQEAAKTNPMLKMMMGNMGLK